MEKLPPQMLCPHSTQLYTCSTEHMSVVTQHTCVHNVCLCLHMYTAPVHMEDTYTHLSIHPGVHIHTQKYKPKIIPNTQ